MINKIKFKKTEIGLIPKDWDVKSLNDISIVIDSCHKTPIYVNKGISMVRVTDVKSGSLDLSNTLKVTKSIYDEFTKNYIPKQNDIIMTRVGTYGITSFVNTTELFCLGQNTVIINPNINSYFLYYALNSKYILNQIEKNVGGSTQKTLSLGDIKKLLVIVPKNNNEMLKIAKILSDLDEKIELNRKMNQTLDEIGKTLFKRWFVDFEFPNEKGEPYKSSGGEMVYNKELKKEIPKGWDVGHLGDNNLTSFTKVGTEDFDEKTYVATADIDNSEIINYNTKITFIKRPSRANMQPKENTVWFAKMKNSKKITYFDKYSAWELENLILSTGFAGLDIKENALYYIWNFVLNDDFEIIKNNLCNGTTMQAINNENIQKIQILNPSNEILKKYNSMIRSTFIKISENKRQNKKLSEIRDLLLPKLMSGKIRVKY